MIRFIFALRNWIALVRLRQHGGVRISSPSKVQYRNIHLKENCALQIGRGSIVNGTLSFDRAGGTIKIGERVFIGSSLLVCADRIEVGNDVLISWGCTIADHNSHPVEWELRAKDVTDWFDGKKDWGFVKTAPVRIGDRAWLGFNVIVLKGVTIGEGAVIGAGSVVTKDVPPYTVAAGNPARVIREIPPDER